MKEFLKVFIIGTGFALMACTLAQAGITPP